MTDRTKNNMPPIFDLGGIITLLSWQIHVQIYPVEVEKICL